MNERLSFHQGSHLLPDLGFATFSPDRPIIAGETGSWQITLIVGALGIDEGGTIHVCRRLPSDWEIPQFDNPEAPGYCSVSTTGSVKLKIKYDPKAGVRPWSHAIVMDIIDGTLQPGDAITIRLGDCSNGSPGLRAQTFVETNHEFRIAVDPTNSCDPRPIENSPVTQIVAGPTTGIFAVVPSLVACEDSFVLRVRGMDSWGNASALSDRDKVTAVWEGTGTVQISSDLKITAKAPGEGFFRVRCGRFESFSNPVTFVTSLPERKPYWGDLHAQTGSTVGTGTEEEYFSFGKEQAFLDFIGHQGNDFQLTSDDWQRLNTAVKKFHQDHIYVVIPGYEWSGNTSSGGDRNVFFLDDDPPIFRSSHWLVPKEPVTADSPAHPANILFERVKNHGRAFTCAHVGGRYADITTYFDEAVCPLVEVVSCWGIFEWLLHDALDRGFVVGVMANSDGHKGRPGNEGPGAGAFGIQGGLTCVLAPELTRDAIFYALKNRNCYGSTGARIHITMDVNGHPMGWKGHIAEEAILQARIVGTAPIEKIEIFRNRERLEVIRPSEFENLSTSRTIRIGWGGARHRGRGRRVKWDGYVEVSGAKILTAQTVAFDSPADGIIFQDHLQVRFCSQTTGDMDFLELTLDRPDFEKIKLTTPEGSWEIHSQQPELNEVDGVLLDLGDLERRVVFQRYPCPNSRTHRPVEFQRKLQSVANLPHCAFYLRVTQTDGQIAWTSPVYLEKHAQPPGSGAI